ncbi:recombinase [Coprococcus comes ATCC 27758]|uniref:Recombinase n=1 Tax=Coprococcus comes ATCC 27758 TaxID=470146 RepID=C0BC38_9FIRM|nr:recombinase [Coprococcus comes ATCC 27758]
MTPFVAFGYRKTKTDKHKLEIDPSAGSVVQDIFKMKLRGMSQDAIANRLNELGILSPFEYKISSGSHYKTGFRQKEQALWSSVTVRRILENEVYIGNLVQGKRTTPNHKVKQTYVKPEDDWIRIEKNHEPLVSDRDFEIVQRLLGMDTRTSPDQKQVSKTSFISKRSLQVNRSVRKKTMRSLAYEQKMMVRIGKRTLIHKKKLEKWIDHQVRH